MDTTTTDLNHLFMQLGLAYEEHEVTAFIASHQIDKHTLLVDAPFWTTAQKTFLQEALNEDAQWSEVIDQLDVMLRSTNAS
ncbi:DUF2789 domain-containing protein [Shewanella sp. OMA3-2]|uniref:DUF2789 domain-containing protein n=1 Tax=Shewanella sp. OMA3-2 TaxID=2908650 RepID=UPI001F2E3031|nr:DUF2789 domain-containing protein [Shewanella sp. OMA3-2]UJF23398.1 DUF2789 domain-containing protein [Shewanella sp. OMA3-2]